MIRCRPRWVIVAAILALWFGLFATGWSADAPPAVKMSSVAPLEDLEFQIHAVVASAQDVTGNRAEFNADSQAQAKSLGNSLIVLAQAAALHDSDGPMKKASGDLLAAGKALAASTDFATAAHGAALAGKAAAAGNAQATPPTKWETAADLGDVMKNVGILSTNVRRGTQGARLKKDAKKTAAQAATLAAIAEAASAYSIQYAERPADPQWLKFCADTRDAAGQLNAAIHAGDAEKTTAALDRLNHSCESCHKVFHNKKK